MGASLSATYGVATLAATYGVPTYMTTVTRGNRLTVTATFKDKDGTVLAPESATIYLSYEKRGRAHAENNPMASGANNTWTYVIDTSDIGSGEAFFSCRSTNPAAAVDGKFCVRANPANPPPALGDTDLVDTVL